MTGYALLAALPCAALALALSRESWRSVLVAIAACVLAAAVANVSLGHLLPAKALVVAAGLATVITLVPVYLRGVRHPVILIALAANAGLWAGALAAASQGLLGLATTLVWLTLWAPAAWLVRRRWEIALKIVASWIVAIAVLAVALNSVSMPSYQLDHME